MNAWRSRLSAIARRNSSLSNGGAARLISRSRLLLSMTTSHTACGAWLFTSFSSGIVAKMKSSLPAAKASSRVAVFGDDRVLDAVEIGPARLPVIRVAAPP